MSLRSSLSPLRRFPSALCLCSASKTAAAKLNRSGAEMHLAPAKIKGMERKLHEYRVVALNYALMQL
jgi:hypothetical protein